MQPPQTPSAQAGPTQEAATLRRPRGGRMIGGVCAGLAAHLDMPVRTLRLAFVAATALSGAGLVAYLFLWALTPMALPGTEPPRPAVRPGRRPWRGADLPSESVRSLAVGVALLVVGVSLVAHRYGINLQLGLLLPLLAIGLGAVLAWSQLDDTQRSRWITASGAAQRRGVLRLVLGMVLASGGVVALATQGRGLGALWNVGVAAVAVLGGAGLIAAPWAVRLWNDLRDEQTQRIRETERADIAAHLHDSVLQTLALIQRKSEDPGEVARLARAQERELRAWLYAGPRGSQASLASAVTEAAHEVEDAQGVPIELVVTGDRPLDDPGTALARALREALVNASRHGAPPVSAYVEIGAAGVEAYVRDHGAGFDPAAIPADRMGVRESIIGRMARHGGTARLRRLEDGTEVAMMLPPPEAASATAGAGPPAASAPAAAPPAAAPPAAIPHAKAPAAATPTRLAS